MVITVVDDGIEYTNPELAKNYVAAASYDYNGWQCGQASVSSRCCVDNDIDPQPRYTNDNINEHGTRVAGVAAGGRNDVCGVGVAYDASIGGIRMLDGDLTDVVEVFLVDLLICLNTIFRVHL